MNLSQERIPDSALELELVYEKGALLRLPRKYMGDIACSTVSGASASIIKGDWSGDLWAGGMDPSAEGTGRKGAFYLDQTLFPY